MPRYPTDHIKRDDFGDYIRDNQPVGVSHESDIRITSWAHLLVDCVEKFGADPVRAVLARMEESFEEHDYSDDDDEEPEPD